MPFKSEKQRRYLWLKHPEIAKRWAKDYPNQKDLPMRVSDEQSEKASAAESLFRYFPTTLNSVKIVNNMSKTRQTHKEADSKQEYVELPQKRGPSFAGETGTQVETQQVNTQPSSEVSKPCKNTDELTANALFKKLAVVLSPKLMQEIEDEKAREEAREAQRMPQNVGVKPFTPPSPTIMPPMGMAQPAPNPGQTQPAQPQQPTQPANGQLASVGGGNSPNANPINSFGGLSSTGDINGNAAFGMQNAIGGEKMAAGNEALAYLMSMSNMDLPDPDDLDYDERMNTTTEKFSALGLWDRIRAKKERGGKPAKPGDKDYPDAKSWKKVTSISEKQSNAAQALRSFLPVAAGGVGGALLGSYGPVMAGGKPNLAATLGGAAAGSGLGMLYSYNDLMNRGKKQQLKAPDDWNPPAAPRYDLEDDDRDWNMYEKQQNQFEKALRQYLKIKGYSKIQPHHYEPGGTPWSMLGPDKKYHEIWMPEDGEPVNKPTPLADMYDFDTPDKAYRKGPGLALVKTSASSPAWQRSAGKNDEGGLNEKGRKSYEREHGGNLKAPVTEKNPTGKAKKRRKSFCSRMCGMKRVNTGAKTKSDPDSRINKSLRKWNCKCSSATQFGVKCAYDWQGRRQYTHVEDVRDPTQVSPRFGDTAATLSTNIQNMLNPELHGAVLNQLRGETLSQPGATPQARAVENYVAGASVPPVAAAAEQSTFHAGHAVNDMLRGLGVGVTKPAPHPIQQEVSGMMKKFGPTLPPAEFQPQPLRTKGSAAQATTPSGLPKFKYPAVQKILDKFLPQLLAPPTGAIKATSPIAH